MSETRIIEGRYEVVDIFLRLEFPYHTVSQIYKAADDQFLYNLFADPAQKSLRTVEDRLTEIFDHFVQSRFGELAQFVSKKIETPVESGSGLPVGTARVVIIIGAADD